MKKNYFGIGFSWLIIFALVLLVLSGSLGGTSGGVWPVYNEKSGESVGVNVAIWTKYQPGAKHIGIDLTLITIQEADSEINGIGISLARSADGNEPGKTGKAIFNGVELAAASAYPYISVPHVKKVVNGLQIGLFVTRQTDGLALQLGVFNENEKRSTLFINSPWF